MNGTNGFTSVNVVSASPPLPDTTAPAGVKRKRDSKPSLKFYAVRVGKEPGIYHTWKECLDQVRGFPKAAFKSFTSLTEAQAFVNGENVNGGGGSGGGSSGKFYGVQSGRNPGVYTSWPEVLEQITGWKGPKHKVFKTRAEAERFVAEAQHGSTMNGDATMESIETIEVSAPQKKTKTSSKGKKGGLKDEDGSPGPAGEGGEYEPGDGPLPEGAEDNFDPTITLDQTTGTARYKTASELAKTKYQATAPVAEAPIRIYTDGSSLSNGRNNAIAGVGVYFGPLDKRNVSEPLTGTKQTNQRAELTAILRALEVAPRDQWFLNWRRNNWHNASNKPVENKDLIGKIIDMLEERFRLNKHRVVDEEMRDTIDGDQPRGHWERGPASVKFEWVKGHANDYGNNAADELAVNGARVAKELGEDVVFD
ncbi:hypothetical protein LTR37_018957 [Vermiconidia calcicola]|uniref:Uncharacterized protein n=1 Tax=Vermiconidia calcicola TaxID=1690605 RepID=A0ACC3MGR6_9PEZI|nr:hypothetical protein LTR37_018957 [Vermiconidia calcicola]